MDSKLIESFLAGVSSLIGQGATVSITVYGTADKHVGELVDDARPETGTGGKKPVDSDGPAVADGDYATFPGPARAAAPSVSGTAWVDGPTAPLYSVGNRVVLFGSGHECVVSAITSYLKHPPQYLLKWTDSSGETHENWYRREDFTSVQ